jgi:hypothetical protein
MPRVPRVNHAAVASVDATGLPAVGRPKVKRAVADVLAESMLRATALADAAKLDYKKHALKRATRIVVGTAIEACRPVPHGATKVTITDTTVAVNFETSRMEFDRLQWKQCEDQHPHVPLFRAAYMWSSLIEEGIVEPAVVAQCVTAMTGIVEVPPDLFVVKDLEDISRSAVYAAFSALWAKLT